MTEKTLTLLTFADILSHAQVSSVGDYAGKLGLALTDTAVPLLLDGLLENFVCAYFSDGDGTPGEEVYTEFNSRFSAWGEYVLARWPGLRLAEKDVGTMTGVSESTIKTLTNDTPVTAGDYSGTDYTTSVVSTSNTATPSDIDLYRRKLSVTNPAVHEAYLDFIDKFVIYD